ncbi:MAG: thermonuclease family protein [Nitrospira sp.]|nr:thermonuclease family protein [Nitrospira sp.]
MRSLPGIHPLVGDHIPVRYAGTDTSEMKGQCEPEQQLARQARALVRSALNRAEAKHLRTASQDQYCRIDAPVLADGQGLYKILIGEGQAVCYDRGITTKDWCAGIGGEARGMFGGGGQ